MVKFLPGAAFTQAQRKMQGAQLRFGELALWDPVTSELQMWYATGCLFLTFPLVTPRLLDILLPNVLLLICYKKSARRIV